jgi:DNA repair ATPase RecN
MKEGFFITELRLTANNLEPAKVSFQKGLNVISGPTNTGKSYIFQCINYMLGSSSKPKNIKEARAYTNIFLEICNYKNEYYTLESDLKGGNWNF